MGGSDDMVINMRIFVNLFCHYTVLASAYRVRLTLSQSWEYFFYDFHILAQGRLSALSSSPGVPVEICSMHFGGLLPGRRKDLHDFGEATKKKECGSSIECGCIS